MASCEEITGLKNIKETLFEEKKEV